MTVPALGYLLGQNPPGALGSSLVIAGANAINSAAGIVGHLGDGGLNW